MTYMLDTNICIYAIKKKTDRVLSCLKSNLDKGLCISAITLAELEHGVANSNRPEKNAASLLQFLSIMDVLPFDDLAAAEYGRIRTDLQRQGTPIGPMDMLIAAHAKARGLILVTNNLREVERIPDLVLENWAE